MSKTYDREALLDRLCDLLILLRLLKIRKRQVISWQMGLDYVDRLKRYG